MVIINEQLCIYDNNTITKCTLHNCTLGNHRWHRLTSHRNLTIQEAFEFLINGSNNIWYKSEIQKGHHLIIEILECILQVPISILHIPHNQILIPNITE